MKVYYIVGSPCSGKSTIAEMISKTGVDTLPESQSKLNLPIKVGKKGCFFSFTQ